MAAEMLHLKVGTLLIYSAPAPAALALALKVQPSEEQFLGSESMELAPQLGMSKNIDDFGNVVHRVELPTGRTSIRYDAVVGVRASPEQVDLRCPLPRIADLPWELMRYTLPSRYCDSDKLLEFAAAQFGSAEGADLGLVQRICDWVFNNLEYRYGACNSQLTAYDVLKQRFGVCRDFAHLAIALCRALNIPARYSSGFLPDIGVPPNPKPMDFHAYMEVYAGGRWHTFDPRHNIPRIGRVRVASGLDAVDVAFATTFGMATLEFFEVWARPV